jgi:glycosyltransferase involved in cell wall biosynthesis
MEKTAKILILTKTPDGGVATYINSLLKISQLNSHTPIEWHVLAIENPQFSVINSGNYTYLRNFRFKNSYRFSPKAFIQFTKDLISVNKKIRVLQPKISIAIDLYPGLLTTIFKTIFRLNTRLILVNQASLKDMIESKTSLLSREILFFFIKALYQSADYIVSTSKHVSQDMINIFKLPESKVKTIYNGIDIPKELIKKLSPQKTILMKFIEPKDQPTLIKAFAIVLKKFPDYRLELIGDGPKESESELLTKKLGISKNVDFLGWKKNIYPYLSRCKIFVLSTKNEGFGYVITEAMAYEKPIIATNAPHGPREILGFGKYGLLVEKTRPDYLAESIIKLLQDPQIYKKFSILSGKRYKFFTEGVLQKKYRKIFNMCLKVLHSQP